MTENSSYPPPQSLTIAGITVPAKALRFFKFGTVGALGFLWDSGTVYGLRPFIGLTAATLIAYFVAATLNWILNRFWTFKGAVCPDHPILQWLRFLLANSCGFLLNRGTVYTLFYTVPLCVKQPVIALAAGAFAGMFANFNLSQKLVFREKAPKNTIELLDLAVELHHHEPPASPPNSNAH